MVDGREHCLLDPAVEFCILSNRYQTCMCAWLTMCS
jgi:hypothetical protein